eukprot:2239789-Rhodomonas_salina.3
MIPRNPLASDDHQRCTDGNTPTTPRGFAALSVGVYTWDIGYQYLSAYLYLTPSQPEPHTYPCIRRVESWAVSLCFIVSARPV